MKKSNFLFIPLLFIAILLGCFFWWRWANQPVFGQDAPAVKTTFVIKKGESLSSVARRLQEEDLIRSSLAFKLLILSANLSGKIQAGSFQLSPSLNPKQITEILTHGTSDIWLTFPEGWRQEEFARRLGSNLEKFSKEEFLELAVDHEGELFPDTYLIPKEASASAVFNLLQQNFQKKFNPDLSQATQKAGLTQSQVLILASLVERESRHESDRPVVAGILIKRWQADWPLQVDAALQYIKGSQNCRLNSPNCDWWPTPTRADKKLPSPFNTYLYKDLPPAPICNPGLASIKAVVYPQESPFWFYLSDLKGNMHYAQTVEEHNANIQKYLQ